MTFVKIERNGGKKFEKIIGINPTVPQLLAKTLLKNRFKQHNEKTDERSITLHSSRKEKLGEVQSMTAAEDNTQGILKGFVSFSSITNKFSQD